MKKAIIFLVSMGMVFYSLAQKTTSGSPKRFRVNEDNFEKSRAQRKTAIVLLSAGGALFLVGSVVALNSLSEDLGNLNIFGPPTEPSNNNATLEAVLLIGGLAAMLTSIGFFISAHKYKRNAFSVSFKNELAPQLQRSIVKYNAVPSLSLKIRL